MNINNYLVNAKRENIINRLMNFISIIFTVIIFISIIFQYNVKATSSSSNSKTDMFYIKIINYTIPLIRVNSFDAEDLAESTISIKDKIFSLLYVDFKNPFTYINKEISYLNVNNKSNNDSSNSEVINLNPFKLTDNDVKKATSQPVPSDKSKVQDNTPDMKVAVENPLLKGTLNELKPEVLIYHTHTTEAYAPFSNSDSHDSVDETKNVCAVGDGITEELEKTYGISTIHDKTVHNYLYTQSYSRSRETLTKYLKKYGDFKIIIDLHRDASTDRKSMVTKMNGENEAKIMFVMATKNPHYDKNIAMVNKLISISKRIYPGFAKEDVYQYNYGTKFFNQDLSNNACLIEVGADCNTIDDAKASSKYIARIIAEYLNGKN